MNLKSQLFLIIKTEASASTHLFFVFGNSNPNFVCLIESELCIYYLLFLSTELCLQGQIHLSIYDKDIYF